MGNAKDKDLNYLFTELEKQFQYPTNEMISEFIDKNAEGFFIDSNLIIEHMVNTINIYLECFKDDFEEFNNFVKPNFTDVFGKFDPKLISFLYLKRTNPEYFGKIEKEFMLYRLFYLLMLRETSKVFLDLGFFREAILLHDFTTSERKALNIWLTGENKLDFLNTESVISDSNKEKAIKRWEKPNQQRAELKQKYLKIMRKTPFHTVTSATDHIFANENPENKKYRWIYDRLTEATKGDMT